MYTVGILGILTLIAIPTFAGILSNTQHSTSEIFLIHMNQDAQGLAAAKGEVAPTYADYAAAASEVDYTSSSGVTAPLTPTVSNSTYMGEVSITQLGSGAGQVTGLAMVSTGNTVSVFLQSTAVAGSAPVVWDCATVSASSANAAAGIRAC
jgi:type II secretory pathway pseudopilin PulG